MSTQYMGEIKLMSFNFAPKNWAQCNGQLFPINQNQALFALLGTTYGGDGRVNFALPDLRGRIPMHIGGGHTLGEKSGVEGHTLTMSELPTHTHAVRANTTPATMPIPAGNVWARGTKTEYAAVGNAAMHPASISNTGGSQPHSNIPPILGLNFCIALQGIFPSRD